MTPEITLYVVRLGAKFARVWVQDDPDLVTYGNRHISERGLSEATVFSSREEAQALAKEMRGRVAELRAKLVE